MSIVNRLVSKLSIQAHISPDTSEDNNSSYNCDLGDSVNFAGNIPRRAHALFNGAHALFNGLVGHKFESPPVLETLDCRDIFKYIPTMLPTIGYVVKCLVYGDKWGSSSGVVEGGFIDGPGQRRKKGEC